mgnify:CR=1 FL=1
MNKIKLGDIVTRKSHGNDILFQVKNIIDNPQDKIAILIGIIERVEADSPLKDLEKADKERINKDLSYIQKRIENRMEEPNSRNKYAITGKILHLDGDRKYSEKSYRYYKKANLNAIVKNIPENKQPKVVYNLLKIYNPDILIITGHDGMIKNVSKYDNIYNYRNSKYFIETVKEARRYDKDYNKNLVIFAGACQSYFEALISAGANFASSPARILIDFVDPLIVAKKIAITEKYKYVTIDDIEKELRDGKKGINGIGANGKMYRIINQM